MSGWASHVRGGGRSPSAVLYRYNHSPSGRHACNEIAGVLVLEGAANVVTPSDG
jgi:hypothetical protein